MGVEKLQTFQLRSRLRELDQQGVIFGDWSRVLPGCGEAYQGMVEAMRRAGVDTNGRPPVWAWQGRSLRLSDASMLYDPEHELVHGFVTVDLDVPGDLVVLSDYVDWCDYLMPSAGSVLGDWTPRPPDPGSVHPAQACLPYLRSGWVRDVRPLPTTGWDDLDEERLA